MPKTSFRSKGTRIDVNSILEDGKAVVTAKASVWTGMHQQTPALPSCWHEATDMPSEECLHPGQVEDARQKQMTIEAHQREIDELKRPETWRKKRQDEQRTLELEEMASKLADKSEAETKLLRRVEEMKSAAHNYAKKSAHHTTKLEETIQGLKETHSQELREVRQEVGNVNSLRMQLVVERKRVEDSQKTVTDLEALMEESRSKFKQRSLERQELAELKELRHSRLAEQSNWQDLKEWSETAEVVNKQLAEKRQELQGEVNGLKVEADSLKEVFGMAITTKALVAKNIALEEAMAELEEKRAGFEAVVANLEEGLRCAALSKKRNELEGAVADLTKVLGQAGASEELQTCADSLTQKAVASARKFGKASALLDGDSIHFLRATERCSICFESDGMCVSCNGCGNTTCITCADNATMDRISACSSVPNRKKGIDFMCFGPRCPMRLPAQMQIVLSDTTVQALHRTRVDLSAMEERIQREKTEMERMRSLALMSPHARTIVFEQQVIKSMMELKCPACASPFESFDGCCALACSRCGCHFCSWCLKKGISDEDTHGHVSRCSKKPVGLPDPLFVDQRVWNKFMHEQVSGRVAVYINKLHTSVRKELQDYFKPLLQA